jgi:tetratricopeptide (TPR) repeat protein
MADTTIDAFCHSATASGSRNGGIFSADAQAHFDCGVAWAHNGAYEQALAAWKQALRFAPDTAAIYTAMGSVYMTLSCWQEAVRSYEKAIQAAPQLLEGYYGLGSAYGKLGDYGRAIDAYNQAFQRLPLEQRLHPETAFLGHEGPIAETLHPEPDTFQDRLRADADGFDFSALLSSPAARRQAIRQEYSTDAPAIAFDPVPTPAESMFRQEPYAETVRASSALPGLNPELHAAVTAATVVRDFPLRTEEAADTEPDESEEDAAYYAKAVRDRRAATVLAVLIVLLGCMGGRMMLSEVQERKDREAYLEATQRNMHIRMNIPGQPVGKGSR